MSGERSHWSELAEALVRNWGEAGIQFWQSWLVGMGAEPVPLRSPDERAEAMESLQQQLAVKDQLVRELEGQLARQQSQCQAWQQQCQELARQLAQSQEQLAQLQARGAVSSWVLDRWRRRTYSS